MQPIVGDQAIRSWLETAIAWLLGDVFTVANIVYTAMQVPSVVGTGFAAWWVHDFFYPWLKDSIERSSANSATKMVFLHLASLVFPTLWLLGLLLSAATAVKFGWPHDLIRMVINLLAAWIAVRVASMAVRDPVWSQVITVVAYTAAALNILHLLDPALAILDHLAVNLGTLHLSLLIVLKAMLSLAVLLWAAALFSKILEKRVQSLPNLTPSVQVLIGKLFKATLVTIAVVVALGSVGIDLTAIAVFSGAVGVGIGFGLQKVVSNLFSGIIVLIDKSIKPGDIIQIGDTYGWVSSLGARYVSIETRDSTEFLIPNEDIITKPVVNWTHNNNMVRLKAHVPVSFRADVDMALHLMVQAATKSRRVLRQPEPRALILGIGDHAINLECRFWIDDVQNGVRNIISEVLLEILHLFEQHGITIPLPQRDVTIRSLIPAGELTGVNSLSPT
jgi:small-conductance mechanosensitive channel